MPPNPPEHELIAQLRSPNVSARLGATEALGRVGTRKALPELDRVAFEDPERDWRSGYSVAHAALEAGNAIRRRGEYGKADVARLMARLGAPGEAGTFATSGLGSFGADAVRQVGKALSSEQDGVRRAGAEILGKIGDRAGSPALCRTLEHDAHAPTRRAAATALRRSGGKGAVRALLGALGDPEAWVRKEAAESLGYLPEASGDPTVLAALRRACDDPHEVTRSWARWSLARLQGDPP